MVQYTEEDWDGDWRALEAGADPPQCDKCLRRGYYGPRLRSPDVKYWLCKFCGFWQHVGEEPKHLIHYLCKHEDGTFRPDWKEPHESWCCPDCGTEYAPDESVPWADEDPLHPFRQAPEHGTRADFQRYWKTQNLVKEWGYY